MNGPTRKQIQRQISGPAPTIGPPPKSSPEPTGTRYKSIKAAKLARDWEALAEREGYRPRSAGPMKPRSRGDAIRNGNGNGESFNGGQHYNGGGLPAVAGAGADNWWMNPLLWAAILGLYLVTRKAKK